MGLTTKNYEIKENGETISTAYAVIKNLRVEGDEAYAIFYVHRTREKCLTLKPLEVKCLRFKFKRFENPFVTAYNLAKAYERSVYVNYFTKDEKLAEKKGIFGGWKDDLIDTNEGIKETE